MLVDGSVLDTVLDTHLSSLLRIYNSNIFIEKMYKVGNRLKVINHTVDGDKPGSSQCGLDAEM